METETLVLVSIAVVVMFVAGVISWIVINNLRSRKLREKFGPEYDHMIEKVGDRRVAEETLAEREKRVNKLAIRTLQPYEWERYHSEWVDIQANFVDEPSESVAEANRLIKEVMVTRGFPMADFEQRAADISVLYPDLVHTYRKAHMIAVDSQHDGVSTEDLRQAMVYYRSLFDELLETDEIKEKEAVR